MGIKEPSTILLCQILWVMCALVSLLRMITKVPLALSQCLPESVKNRMLCSSTKYCGQGDSSGHDLASSCLCGEVVPDRYYEGMSLLAYPITIYV